MIQFIESATERTTAVTDLIQMLAGVLLGLGVIGLVKLPLSNRGTTEPEKR